MYNVSVIVPVYYGKKYIAPMIRQMEICCECAGKNIAAELLLVNDAPDDPLPDSYTSERIDIVVLNTEVNCGVQGARVKGVENSRGRYILLLDQDDKIAPEYLKSQLEKIGGSDAVVCQALHEEKPFYNLTRPFKESICKDYMLRKGNSIISPGQVLMKKEAVSEIWKKNILHNKGADDWLLWLGMMEAEKTFALNEELLFEHVVEGSNASWKALEMQRSEAEVLQIIRSSCLFAEKDIDLLAETVKNLMETRLRLLEKFQKISSVYDKWISLKNKGIHMAKYLRQERYESIAIYGVTALGKQLCRELEGDGLKVAYFIDRNAAFFSKQNEVCSPEEELHRVDAVIISLVQDERQIADSLKMKLSADIWSITELLEKMDDLLDEGQVRDGTEERG